MKRALALVLLLVACEGAPVDDVVVGEGEGEGEQPLWEGTVRRERSLAWTDDALLDESVGLDRVMGAAAASMGVSNGEMMHAWLTRFATTAHSERAGPAQLAAQLVDTLGSPETWNLDDTPFRVTGVHNRTDLARDGHCGELRVSFASTDPIVRPFHVLFLFRQPGPDCEQTWLRWAQLSDLDGEDFFREARALLDEGITPEKFLMIETVELTVSPWEWRQWIVVDGALENPPLFQQVVPERVDEEFIAFANENRDALIARTLLIPERFRVPSARVVQGAPWIPLAIDDELLRKNIEIVGCTACHTADAAFVQTRDDRTFSPFYTKELIARGQLLDDIMHRRPRTVPFGPLQADPVLPP